MDQEQKATKEVEPAKTKKKKTVAIICLVVGVILLLAVGLSTYFVVDSQSTQSLPDPRGL